MASTKASELFTIKISRIGERVDLADTIVMCSAVVWARDGQNRSDARLDAE